jgi:hypothetical protein
VADFVICPRCRRQNPADSIFCNRCGVRLLNAGVYYNRRDSGSGVGTGQLLLGLGVLILAGLVLGGGAIVLLANRPGPTPTHIAVGPTPTGAATLSTASPSPVPVPTLVTPAPTATLIPTGFPTVAPTITPEPTPVPTATPVPTPAPTPLACALASQGTDVKEWQLGLGHDTQKVPNPKSWCIRHVTIGSWSGWGQARLMLNNKVVLQASCLPPGPCADADQDYAPPYQVNHGKVLRYVFTCFDDPSTPDPINECTDATSDGAVITISYEAFAAP